MLWPNPGASVHYVHYVHYVALEQMIIAPGNYLQLWIFKMRYIANCYEYFLQGKISQLKIGSWRVGWA